MNHSFFLPGTHLKDDWSSRPRLLASGCLGGPVPLHQEPFQPFHGGAHKCRCSRKFHQTWCGSTNRMDRAKTWFVDVCWTLAKWGFHPWNFGVLRRFSWVWLESTSKLGWPVTTEDLSCRYHEFWVKSWLNNIKHIKIVPGHIWKRVPWYPAVAMLFEDPNPSKRRSLPCHSQCWDVGRSNVMGLMVDGI